MTAPTLVADPQTRVLSLGAVASLDVGRARGLAWGLAIGLHAALLALALVVFERVEGAPPEIVRLVFVEPAPPPPPLAGAPGATGAVAAVPVEQPKPQLVVPPKVKPKVQPRPKPKPRPVVEARREPPKPKPVEPAPVEVQAGSAAGATNGAAAGQAGGVAGGQVGGVVGGRGSGPVPAGQVAHPPTVVSRVDPQYPRPARLAGIEGRVVLEAILDTQGRIGSDIKVLRSVPQLDDAAIAALRRWRFKPARNEGGQAVPVILEVPIRFVLR